MVRGAQAMAWWLTFNEASVQRLPGFLYDEAKAFRILAASTTMMDDKE